MFYEVLDQRSRVKEVKKECEPRQRVEQGPNKYLCDYITSGVTHVNKYREYLKLNKYLKIKKAQRSLVQTFTE